MRTGLPDAVLIKSASAERGTSFIASECLPLMGHDQNKGNKQKSTLPFLKLPPPNPPQIIICRRRYTAR